MEIKPNEEAYYFWWIILMLWLIALNLYGEAFGALAFVIGIFSLCCAFDLDENDN